MNMSTSMILNCHPVGKLMPRVPIGCPVQVFDVLIAYYNIFYGGNKDYGIPSVNKIKRMTNRLRKKNHANGKFTCIGYEITLKFSRTLTAQDAVDPSCFSYMDDEHSLNVGNWFLPEVENHGLYTVMGIPLEDPIEVTWLVYAHHEHGKTVYDQILQLTNFLNAVNKKDFICSWNTKWMVLDYYDPTQDDSYEFYDVSSGDFKNAV